MMKSVGSPRRLPCDGVPSATGKHERLRESVADGIYDRFVDEIVTGRLKHGEKLPTMQRIADENGVTFRIARGVVERLVREGYVRSRPHVGTVVCARKHTVWRGRVLFVSFDDDCASYFVAQVADALRRHLLKEGYLLTPVVASRSPHGDVSQLKTALGQSVDFVVIMYASAHIERLVARAGYPYMTCYSAADSRPGAWAVNYDVSTVLETFAKHCRQAGVRSVTEVRFKDAEGASAAPLLEGFGVRVSQMTIAPLSGYGRYEGLERAAMEDFLTLRNSAFPDLFLFWDDFIAQGALTALLARGIRIPKDVKIVAQTNRGLGPVFPLSLTRFECDGAAVGERVSAFVIGVLRKGRLPTVPRMSPTYVFGKTFPWE